MFAYNRLSDNYYNEIDKKAAAWLRELIRRGLIAPGDVDERSIEDVQPDDLRGYVQCHWFAGIGVWSHALRRAGWEDTRPVWTGSCPCQPFSAAGKSGGFADERHLWPAWAWLIAQCRPERIYGEQVASKDADTWLDLVQDDLEGMGYAVGATPFPAAGIGTPNIRDRLYWMADAPDGGRREERPLGGRLVARDRTQGLGARLGDGRGDGRVADAVAGGWSGASRSGAAQEQRTTERNRHGGLADANSEAGGRRRVQRSGESAGTGAGSARERSEGLCETDPEQPGPTNGIWRDADWLFCRDGKWRPVEPGTFPLAHGAPGRVGRLRGYGNAINAEAARHWIEVSLEAETAGEL